MWKKLKEYFKIITQVGQASKKGKEKNDI